MKGYLEEKAWVSCTLDSFGTPRQLQKRVPGNVYHKSTTNLMLVKQDTAVIQQFTCNSPMKTFFGALAKALVVAAFVVSGPVGWLIVGAIAVAVLAATVYVASHMCNSGLEGKLWLNYKENVKYNGGEGVFYLHSTIICANKGTLVASESFEAANALSNKMALRNWGQNATKFAVKAFSSFITCTTLGPAAGTIDLGLDLGKDYVVDKVDNKSLTAANNLNLLKTPGLSNSAYKAMSEAPLLSGRLIADAVKGTTADVASFIRVARVAPRLSFGLIKPGLLSAAKGVGKGVGIGAVTWAIEYAGERAENKIASYNEADIKMLDKINKAAKTIVAIKE